MLFSEDYLFCSADARSILTQKENFVLVEDLKAAVSHYRAEDADNCDNAHHLYE